MSRHFIPLSGSPDWAAGVIAKRKMTLDGMERRGIGNAKYHAGREQVFVEGEEDYRYYIVDATGLAFSYDGYNQGDLLKRAKKYHASANYCVFAYCIRRLMQINSHTGFMLQYTLWVDSSSVYFYTTTEYMNDPPYTRTDVLYLLDAGLFWRLMQYAVSRTGKPWKDDFEGEFSQYNSAFECISNLSEVVRTEHPYVGYPYTFPNLSLTGKLINGYSKFVYNGDLCIPPNGFNYVNRAYHKHGLFWAGSKVFFAGSPCEYTSVSVSIDEGFSDVVTLPMSIGVTDVNVSYTNMKAWISTPWRIFNNSYTGIEFGYNGLANRAYCITADTHDQVGVFTEETSIPYWSKHSTPFPTMSYYGLYYDDSNNSSFSFPAIAVADHSWASVFSILVYEIHAIQSDYSWVVPTIAGGQKVYVRTHVGGPQLVGAHISPANNNLAALKITENNIVDLFCSTSPEQTTVYSTELIHTGSIGGNWTVPKTNTTTYNWSKAQYTYPDMAPELHGSLDVKYAHAIQNGAFFQEFGSDIVKIWMHLKGGKRSGLLLKFPTLGASQDQYYFNKPTSPIVVEDGEIKIEGIRADQDRKYFTFGYVVDGLAIPPPEVLRLIIRMLPQSEAEPSGSSIEETMAPYKVTMSI